MVLDWEEIYAGWEETDLKYYWKEHDLKMAEWNENILELKSAGY